MIQLRKAKNKYSGLSGSEGFTLVELLVVSPIIMIVTVAIVTFIFNQYGQLVKQNAQLNMQVESQNILFGLQDDLWYANQFASVINGNLTDAYAPAGGWTSGTTPPTLIVSTAALTTNRRSVDRQLVYINQSTCTPPDGGGVNDILYDNIIYFMIGTNLYKRTLSAPVGMSLCGIPYEKQTCPATSATEACPADSLLSDHVSSFNITYYTADNTVTSTPETAESVKVSIGLHDKAYAEDIYASTSLRLKKLNQL